MTRLPVSRVDATPRRRWCLTREVFAEGVEPKFTTRKSRPKKTFKKASPKHRRRFRNPPRFQRRNFASCSAPPLVWWICQNQTPCSAKPRPGLRRVGRSAPRTRRRNALVTVRAVSPQNQKPIGGETKRQPKTRARQRRFRWLATSSHAVFCPFSRQIPVNWAFQCYPPRPSKNHGSRREASARAGGVEGDGV